MAGAKEALLGHLSLLQAHFSQDATSQADSKKTTKKVSNTNSQVGDLSGSIAYFLEGEWTEPAWKKYYKAFLTCLTVMISEANRMDAVVLVSRCSGVILALSKYPKLQQGLCRALTTALFGPLSMGSISPNPKSKNDRSALKKETSRKKDMHVVVEPDRWITACCAAICTLLSAFPSLHDRCLKWTLGMFVRRCCVSLSSQAAGRQYDMLMQVVLEVMRVSKADVVQEFLAKSLRGLATTVHKSKLTASDTSSDATKKSKKVVPVLQNWSFLAQARLFALYFGRPQDANNSEEMMMRDAFVRLHSIILTSPVNVSQDAFALMYCLDTLLLIPGYHVPEAYAAILKLLKALSSPSTVNSTALAKLVEGSQGSLMVTSLYEPSNLTSEKPAALLTRLISIRLLKFLQASLTDSVRRWGVADLLVDGLIPLISLIRKRASSFGGIRRMLSELVESLKSTAIQLKTERIGHAPFGPEFTLEKIESVKKTPLDALLSKLIKNQYKTEVKSSAKKVLTKKQRKAAQPKPKKNRHLQRQTKAAASNAAQDTLTSFILDEDETEQRL